MVRLGIYSVHRRKLAGANVVLDAGTVDASGTGVKPFKSAPRYNRECTSWVPGPLGALPALACEAAPLSPSLLRWRTRHIWGVTLANDKPEPGSSDGGRWCAELVPATRAPISNPSGGGFYVSMIGTNYGPSGRFDPSEPNGKALARADPARCGTGANPRSRLRFSHQLNRGGHRGRRSQGRRQADIDADATLSTAAENAAARATKSRRRREAVEQ